MVKHPAVGECEYRWGRISSECAIGEVHRGLCEEFHRDYHAGPNDGKSNALEGIPFHPFEGILGQVPLLFECPHPGHLIPFTAPFLP
jgi:hypothetical protein